MTGAYVEAHSVHRYRRFYERGNQAKPRMSNVLPLRHFSRLADWENGGSEWGSNPLLNVVSTRYRATEGDFNDVSRCKAVVTDCERTVLLTGIMLPSESRALQKQTLPGGPKPPPVETTANHPCRAPGFP